MRSRWNVQYYERVIATDPIAYWMLDEKQGNVAYDTVSGRVAGARNGAITGATLGQDGIGDGRTSYLFDGANDYVDVYTASLAAAFDGSEGTAMVWARVSGAGVWTDGASRWMVGLRADTSNRIRIIKSNVANRIEFRYQSGGTANIINYATSSVTWMSLAVTWSVSADEVRAYFGGVQTGATQSGLGVWAGSLIATNTTIGALSTAPSNVMDGYEAHCAIWSRALLPAEMLSLGVL